MALVRKQTRRLDYEAEPGTWFEVSLPLSAGDLAGLSTDGQQIGMSLDLLASVVTAWSYPEPVTVATVRQLDIDCYSWLVQQVFASSGIRDEAEKKDSDSEPSRPMSTAGSSRRSSAT